MLNSVEIKIVRTVSSNPTKEVFGKRSFLCLRCQHHQHLLGFLSATTRHVTPRVVVGRGLGSNRIPALNRTT